MVNITFSIAVNQTESPTLPGDVFFGADTPVGEGGTTVDATDGDYDGGNFTVASNLLTVKSGGTPSVGQITVGSTTVDVVAGRSVATASELESWLDGSNDTGTMSGQSNLIIAQDIADARSTVSTWNNRLQAIPDDFTFRGAYPNGTKPRLDYFKMQTTGVPANKSTVTRFKMQNFDFYDPIDLTRSDGITNVNFEMLEFANIDLQGLELDNVDFFSNLDPINSGGVYPGYFQNGIAPTNDVVGLWIHDCEFHNLMYPIRGNPNGALIENNAVYDTLADFFNPEGGTSNWILRSNDARGVIGDGTVLHADFNQHQIQTGADRINGVFIFGNTSTPGEYWSRAWPQIDADATFGTHQRVGDTGGTISSGATLQRLRFEDLTTNRTIALPDAASNDGLTFVAVNESDSYSVTLVPAGSDTVADSGVMWQGTSRYYSDGTTQWKRTPVGYATKEIPVQSSTKVIDGLYDQLLIGAKAHTTITLDTGGSGFAFVRKHDLDTGSVVIEAGAGQTIEGGSSIKITQSGGARELRRTGSEWSIFQYNGVSMQGCFGNIHPDYDDDDPPGGKDKAYIAANFINNYNIAGNVFYLLSGNGIWLEQPIPDTYICYNTVIAPVASDFDGDGQITLADGWSAQGIGKVRANPYSLVMNNFTISEISQRGPDTGDPLSDTGIYSPIMRDNTALNISDPTSGAAATLHDYFVPSTDTGYQPTTQAEVLSSVTLDTGTLMPTSVGAVGTTTANGPWDFVNKRFNLPAPAWNRVFPEQNSAAVPLDAVLFVEANVPIISTDTGTTLDTGVALLYNVTDGVSVPAQFTIFGNRIECRPDSDLTTGKQYRIVHDGAGIASYFENLSVNIGNSGCDPVTFYDTGGARLAPAIDTGAWNFTADSAAQKNEIAFYNSDGDDISQYADGTSFALTAEQRFDNNQAPDKPSWIPPGDAIWSVEVQDQVGNFDLRLFITGGSGANIISINTDNGSVLSASDGTENIDYGVEDIEGDGSWWRVWIKGNGVGMTRYYLGVNNGNDSVTVRRPMCIFSNDPDAPYVVPLSDWT